MSDVPFAAVHDWLPASPRPGEGSDADGPPVGAGGCSFSDDLVVGPSGRRAAVRVRITDRGDGGWVLDLRDSDEREKAAGFALGETSVITAAARAFGRALGRGEPIAATRLSVVTDPETFVGGDDADDPARVAFAMARIFDAVSGALANAWPGQVGAGSCSLGAIVSLRSDGDELVEVLPGGEGATPTRAGADAWSGPILATRQAEPPPRWVAITRALRSGSGGVGARHGGAGLRVEYRALRPVVAQVAIDRADNPPHGLLRAGPPVGARLRVERGGEAIAVRPWAPFTLEVGAVLVVETCGGAGHGFPGWGDIDWDG